MATEEELYNEFVQYSDADLYEIETNSEDSKQQLTDELRQLGSFGQIRKKETKRRNSNTSSRY